MEMRVFVPIMLHTTLLNLLFFSNRIAGCFSKLTASKKLFLSIFLLFLSFYEINNLKDEAESYRKKIAQNKVGVEKLAEMAEGKIIVPDAYAFMVLFFNNFSPQALPDLAAFKAIYLMDIETLSLSPDYKLFLDKHCKCNSSDLAAFYDYLYSIRKDVVIVGNEQRIKFFEHYLREVRKRTYTFEKMKDFKHEINNESTMIGLYEIQ
jgi:hypothetical protein